MKGKFSFFLVVMVLVVLAAGAVALFVLHERELPTISLETDLSVVGLRKQITFAVQDKKSGIQSITAVLSQDGKELRLLDVVFPRQGYFGHAGAHQLTKTLALELPPGKFADGRADLTITAGDFSFWNFMQGNVAQASFPVILDQTKPKVRVVDVPRYIKAGGSSIVVYRANEPLLHHGAVINGHLYPGFPLSREDPNLYGALLALPYDTTMVDEMYLSVTDRAGNLGKAPFSMLLRPLRPQHDRINVSDGFLKRKIPEFMNYFPAIAGENDLERYLYVNRAMRQENNQKIREICSVVTPDKLWQGRFRRLPRSSRRSGFADYRSYYYKNTKVDNQVHLGIDLASVRHAPVPAANGGRVVFADYNGIYGNMVVVDHGWGLFSLYSHLSQIKVAVGDAVETGTVLGNTGKTGMAGGDHLHFGMLVNGIFVNPLEWWDRKWLARNIEAFL